MPKFPRGFNNRLVSTAEEMALDIGSNRSRFVAFTAVFTAMIAVLDIISTGLFYAGIWDSWMFLISPLVGVLLGPYVGALSVGLGNLVGHIVYFRDPYELVFMIGAPLGAAMAGFVYQKRWRPTLVIYSLLLLGYFLTPVTWALPLIGIWDILVGYGVLLVFCFITVRGLRPTDETKGTFFDLFMSAVIGLESDVLLRVFILVPGQTYWFFYGWTEETLYDIWIAAGVIIPIKVLLSTIALMAIGIPLLRQLPNLQGDTEPA
jgi:hypothetical protein